MSTPDLELVNIEVACEKLRAGDVIAYPTEAVYGLGCDIFNQKAVLRILTLKKRLESKGLIVLVSDFEQLWSLVDKVQLPSEQIEMLRQTWPGPVTWVFPALPHVPNWVRGTHHGVAIRMSAHPIAHALCENGPIISTSANISGGAPARDIETLSQLFPEGVAAVVKGALGGRATVSQIYNILDGMKIRGL